MRTTLLASLVVVLLLLSACGTPAGPAEYATEPDDVLGVWHRTKRFRLHPQIYMQLREDGSMGISRVPDKWERELMSYEFAFDGTRFAVTETAFRITWGEGLSDFSCTGGVGAPDGAYEIQLLANGNLKFVNAEDNCVLRRELLGMAEWAPVP